MNQSKTKIFVSAYACEPNKGSEPGVGWHWVLEMSKYFDVWVLTRKNNQESINKHFISHQKPDTLHFLYYDPPKYLTFWKNKLKGVHFYYAIWQRGVNRIIKKTMAQENISIFHLLTFGTILLPVSKIGQKNTFIWGPVGGGNIIPKEYYKHYHLKGRIVELTRKLMLSSLQWNRAFKNRCKNATTILCKDEATLLQIPKEYRHKGIVFTDVAVDIPYFEEEAQKTDKIKTTFIAVGQLEAWRGFDLIIEATKEAIKVNENIHVNILGEGHFYQHLEQLISRYNLKKHISLLGKVDISTYHQMMSNTHVVINTCLKEGAVTTSFDSIKYLKPLICVDTGGYTKYFNNEYARVIKRRDRDTLIKELSQNMLELSKPETREKISSQLKNLHDKFSWQSKGIAIKDVINKLIKQENR